MDPELQRAAAERWEQLVASGVDKQAATSQVDEWLSRRQKAAEFKSEADAFAEEAETGVELEPESPVSSGFKTGLRTILSGALLGGADELGAAVRAAPRLLPGGQSFGEAYREGKEAFSTAREGFREDHPFVATTGEIAGAVAPGLAAGPLVGAGKIGLGRLMALGAAEGGAAGALESEGGLGARAGGAAKGAAAGAATAGVLTGAGRMLRGAGTRALDVTNLRPSSESGFLGRMAQRVGIDPVEARADERLAAALPVGETLDRAKSTLAGTDRPLSLMDIDENVAGVARAARGVQGPAKRELPAYLARRTAGQEARILDDALKLTGVGERASITDTVDDIVQRRAAQARPLYEAAYEKTVPREVLGDVLDDPAFRDAYERGARIAARDGVDLAPISQMLPEGSMGPQEIPVQAIDYMKRGLDDAIESGMRSARGMGRQEARGIRNQLRAMLKRVDEAVPEYKAAREAFAGKSRMLDALEQGNDLFKMDPAEARKVAEALPDSEREMFVRGGLEALAERVENASASYDITRRRPLADRTRDRERLRLLFPDDDAFKAFQNAIAEEAQIARTSNFVRGGSNTAEKLMEMAELAGVNLSTLMSGGLSGIASQMAGSALVRRSQGFTGDVGRALVPSLTAEGDDALRVLNRLTDFRTQVGQRLSRQERIGAGAGAAAAGMSVGRRNENRPRDR